jgi:modulator of FtsH protease HflC
MNRSITAALAVLVMLVTVWSGLYTVSETEQVVITQFGRPIGEAVTAPGLHVKLPFVQDVNRFDKRWLEWDGDANQVPTRDKKYIWVDTYARWRIADPLRFFQRLRDERGAQSRLDDIIDGETRNVIASHNLIEVVRSSNRVFEQGEEAQDILEEEARQEVAHGRDRITRMILQRSSTVMPEFGVELVDVQIQRINYVDSVQTKVFERMISERKRIADRHRSEGQGKSAEIRGKKERELKRIDSEAYRKGQEIMGKADAEAASIYSAAYGRDGDLYRFVRTLTMYRDTVDKETSLVLSTDDEVFRYLRSSNAGHAAPAPSRPRAPARTTLSTEP